MKFKSEEVIGNFGMERDPEELLSCYQEFQVTESL